MFRISKATAHNWRRLGSDSTEKLKARANKTRSGKRVTATSYLNDSQANTLLQEVQTIDSSVENIMYTLVCSALNHKGLTQKQHVRKFLRKYDCLACLDIDIPFGTWDSDEDILGFIYQSLLTEGEKNITGQYYTHRNVVKYIIGKKRLADAETFLDPCCGSGAFLLGVTTNNPSNLYGFDINPTAVMIASANLLIKYSDKAFTPNIFCMDFLNKGLPCTEKPARLPSRFDYIYTNPPWGRDKQGIYACHYPAIKSKERASMVIVESVRHLKEQGTLCFLLPTSLLKIKSHRDIREYILYNTTIRQIDLYEGRFDGVFTDYFSIRLCPQKTEVQKYHVTNNTKDRNVTLSKEDMASGNIALGTFSTLDYSIIKKMETSCHDDLSHSQWALGIVTGDNKNKVKKEKAEGLEHIYAGKHVSPFKLQDTQSYISFTPKNFQQCAREEFFRCPEKLIYRFIAKYPIVAYDDQQSLCLNSANILIPQLDSISIKSTAALLNSTLYHYYYSLMFTDIKVLKGNLQKLPFPKLTQQEDKKLSSLVSRIRTSSFTQDLQQELDNKVYSIFHITSEEQELIHDRLEIGK